MSTEDKKQFAKEIILNTKLPILNTLMFGLRNTYYLLCDAIFSRYISSNQNYDDPIKRHILNSLSLHYRGKGGIYYEWTTKRINKILSIYGISEFSNSNLKILELGCNYAEIGSFFSHLGCSVLSIDGRKENINIARLMNKDNKNISFEVFDLDKDFSRFGNFDIIFNFGLLYHLTDPIQHLERCMTMSNKIILETQVLPTMREIIQKKRDEPKQWDMGLSNIVNVPSPLLIENLFKENGYICDTHHTDLDVKQVFSYDWEAKNNKRSSSRERSYTWRKGLYRRFWNFTKNNTGE